MNSTTELMNSATERARRDLGCLGLRGRDIHLAELVPAIEMAWADGEIGPSERTLLEAYCEALTSRLNHEGHAGVFLLARNLLVLDRLTQRRLSPSQRLRVLSALSALKGRGVSAAQMNQRMFEWAEAVAAVEGSPVWDVRELLWIETMRRNLEGDS